MFGTSVGLGIALKGYNAIAADQKALPQTPAQRKVLDQPLVVYELDKNSGRLAPDVLTDLRRKSWPLKSASARRRNKTLPTPRLGTQKQRPGLGLQFLEATRDVCTLIAERPLAYHIVHRAARRALPRRFPSESSTASSQVRL